MSTAPLTPMMQQYRAAQAAHPGMLILFRNGDFYEFFENDAELGHRLLGLTLTRRDKEIPMAGFPQHKLEHYLNILLKSGHRVAVCEQMEEAGGGKKIIRREVNRVVTPGTVTEDELLDARRPNYLCAIARGRAGLLGLAWVDPSTGSFAAADLLEAKLPDELARLTVVECLLPEDQAETLLPLFGPAVPATITRRPAWTFDPSTALAAVHKQFGVATMAGFGFEDGQPALIAAGAVLIYLHETLRASLTHIRTLRSHRNGSILVLDEVTRRSLELTRSLRDNLREGSVLSALDRTVTPMGARFLHDALLAPLIDRSAIENRLDAVQELLTDHALRGQLREQLAQVGDLQRLTSRVSTARANPKDLAAVLRTLRLLPKIKAKLTGRKSRLLQEQEATLALCPDLREYLDQALTDDPPYSPKEGGIIREGFHHGLDELRRLTRDGKDWIARYQADEIARTGISSLKVGYVDVMGYFIEITNANENRVPPEYIHERTLKNCKRYSTPALKEYEEKVVTAQERSLALEFDLFLQVRDATAAQTHQLLQTADVLATMDFLAGLAELAASRNYTRPRITDDPTLAIVDGRHPVLDQTLPPGTFVPNDVHLSPGPGNFWLLTGPNMSGKSTFIRQVALVTLLAHIGSFVPARSATVGITDRIFTRVGASDELSRGQSTFMVEMTEAANILNNATARSLVILDEIGRGTSTYDGLSLAWAITEYLHDTLGCRSLFATHYHELAQLAGTLPRLRNFTVQVKELAKEIIFLHKIVPGNAGKSYGIHVARLAGVPAAVLDRAEDVLAALEGPKKDDAEPPSDDPAPKPILVDPPERPRRRPRNRSTGPSLFGDGE